MFPSMKKLNLDKIAKQLLAAAIKSSLEDAKLHERKEESSRMMAEVLKQLAPAMKQMLADPPPFKPQKMTKKQKDAFKKAMKQHQQFGTPVMVGTPMAVRPS
jgi:hypothetical protein